MHQPVQQHHRPGQGARHATCRQLLQSTLTTVEEHKKQKSDEAALAERKSGMHIRTRFGQPCALCTSRSNSNQRRADTRCLLPACEPAGYFPIFNLARSIRTLWGSVASQPCSCNVATAWFCRAAAVNQSRKQNYTLHKWRAFWFLTEKEKPEQTANSYVMTLWNHRDAVIKQGAAAGKKVQFDSPLTYMNWNSLWQGEQEVTGFCEQFLALAVEKSPYSTCVTIPTSVIHLINISSSLAKPC